MAPAFNSSALKEMYPIFVRKAEELRDRWDKIAVPSSPAPYPTPPSTPSGERESNPADISSAENRSLGTIVDVCDWMNRATLDIIGLVGFGYNFDSLMDRCEEVCVAYRAMLQAAEKPPGFKELLALWFPIIEDILVTRLALAFCSSTDLRILARRYNENNPPQQKSNSRRWSSCSRRETRRSSREGSSDGRCNGQRHIEPSE